MAHQCFMEMDVSAARLPQSAERKALNLVVVGSSPTVGDLLAKSRMQGALAAKGSYFFLSSMLLVEECGTDVG